MARTQAPSRSTSARRVTLLAQGMRPLTVTAPCFLFLLEQLVGLHDDAVVLLVVAHTERGHDPRGLREVEQVHLGRHRALGRAQLGDEPGEIVTERLHLALLALEGDDGVPLACLQIEDALARLADGSRGEEIRLLEVERLAHLMPTRVRSPSMEFTVRAALLDTP